MAKAYTSTINLSKLAKTYGVLPAKVNKDIGLRYRKYRSEKMAQGLALDTLQPHTKLKPATVKAKIRHGSPTPTIPLMDTANMSRGTNIVAKDGLLEITQGVTRQQIQAFHQKGAGHNPVRVSLAWNSEFLEGEAYPIIRNHYSKMIANARRTG